VAANLVAAALPEARLEGADLTDARTDGAWLPGTLAGDGMDPNAWL